MHKPTDFLTPKEVAELLMVSPITVRQWSKKGLLKAELTAGKHRRYFRHEVERFARENGLTFKPRDADKLKILIVDDDVQLTKYLTELLDWYPEVGAIEIAHNGFEAGIKVNAFEPHVVLLDLMMPDLDGFSVCKLLKENPNTRAIRVVAMTGNHSQENIQRITQYGAETCFAKPIDEEQLLTHLGLSKNN